MKFAYLSILCITLCIRTEAQVRIHSHNDYTHEKPFSDAVAVKTWSIEADVFAGNGQLLVAHSRKEIDTAKTLEDLYFKKIAALSKNKAFYSFQLMIDPKDKWEQVYPVLKTLLEKYKKYFRRGDQQVLVTISGNRPPDSTFHTYPDPIRFDGLPGKDYLPADLAKVAMISDNFSNYSKWKGVGMIPAADKSKLLEIINAVHKLHKPMRFWGAPDNPSAWALLAEMGADIINTDKPAECRIYFKLIK